MATYGFDDIAFVLVDGYSLNAYITEMKDTKEAIVEDATTAGDSWAESAYVGVKDFSLEFSGYYDDADNASDEAMVDQYSTRTICYGVEGNTLSKAVVMLSGLTQSKWTRVAARGSLHKFNATYDGSGEVENGKIIAPLAARTIAGDTTATPDNNAAESTGGSVAYLQVTALSLGGYTNVIPKLQDSADNVTYADVTGGAFTAVTAAPAKQRLVIAGTVRQYTAIAWTYTGSGESPTWTGMVGLHRN